VSYYSLSEIRALLEQTCKQSTPRGSGDQWRLVEDDLTGTLIVTATPGEHQRIAELVERLNATPGAHRRPMRTFPIRNRSVNEILEILVQLVERGALEASSQLTVESADASEQGAQARAQQGNSQVTARTEETVGESQRSPSNEARRHRTRQSAGERRALELTADEGTNTLIAIGEPRLLEQLEQLIAQLDRRQPQVKIEVLVVGLTDADTLDLGVELRKLEVSGNTLISLASLFGLSSGSLAAGTVTSSGAGFSGVVLNPGDFAVVVRALQTINDGRSVNMPHLLVNNNQSGTLNSVLQQPFTSTNASDTVATTSFAGTQDAGTTVTVRPQIAEGDHLVLEYAVAISNFVGDSSAPGIPPPRQQNSLQSIVTIPDGYTIAVGGIEIVSDAEAVSQLPLLGDIPGLGELFKNRSNTRSRSRFYVFIKATVLRHGGFEDLKYLSEIDMARADIDDGWPVVHPRLIR
jgi:general secretion pathway protein D